ASAILSDILHPSPIRQPSLGGLMTLVARALLVFILLAACALAPASPVIAAEGQMTIGAHVTLAPKWLDPAETESAITPFLVMYFVHDAMVKPMPQGQ